MKLKLNRFYQNNKVTLGCLTGLYTPLFTCELPWNNNEPNVSCIPSGTYKLILWESPKFGKCLKVLDVPNRGDILFHTGNSAREFVDTNFCKWEQDTHGCILVGLNCRNDGIVQNSRDAFNMLMKSITEDSELIITPYE